jgi:hypothetical protein
VGPVRQLLQFAPQVRRQVALLLQLLDPRLELLRLGGLGLGGHLRPDAQRHPVDGQQHLDPVLALLQRRPERTGELRLVVRPGDVLPGRQVQLDQVLLRHLPLRQVVFGHRPGFGDGLVADDDHVGRLQGRGGGGGEQEDQDGEAHDKAPG